MTIFAIRDHSEDGARRILIDAALDAAANDLVRGALESFVSDELDFVVFDGRLNADESQVLILENFVPTDAIRVIMGEPAGVAILEPQDLDGACAALAFRVPGVPSLVALQYFDRRQVLASKGLGAILTGDTFVPLRQPGFVISDDIDGVVDTEGNRFMFRSLARARRLVDMADHYREATRADLARFCALPRIIGDEGALERNADSWIRRKLALVLDTGMVEQHGARVVADRAAAYGVEVEVRNKDGTPAIVLPNDKRRLRQLLRFLDDDFYTSVVGGRRYVSNSKQRL